MTKLNANGNEGTDECPIREIPPGKNTPASASPRRKITLNAFWGNEDAESTVRISPTTWREIQAGVELSRGAWSYYEGRRYHVVWHFKDGQVSIHGDDGMDCMEAVPVETLLAP